MEVAITKNEAKELVKKWGAKDIVIPDEIIDAYTEGKKNGIIKYADELTKKRKASLLEAMSISNEEIKFLEEELNLDIHKAFLRQLVTDDECYYKTLIVIDKDKYLDNDITEKAYSKLIEKSKTLRTTKKLKIDFALMPKKRLNTHLLIGDGYIYHYDKKEKPRRS